MIGLVFALSSMLFAGLTDFCFKKYVNRAGMPLGSFLAGIGLVWAVFFAVPLLVKGGADWQGWPIALAAGVASVAANILLVASLRHLDAGVGSTIYRLNMVIVLVLSVVLLNEELNPMKLAAIALGVGAVLLMYQRVPAPEAETLPCGPLLRARTAVLLRCSLPFLLVVAASLLRAAMGLLFKVGMNRGFNLEFLVITGLCWLVGGLLYGLCSRESVMPTPRIGWYGLVTGLVICGNVYFLAQATANGQASIVIPVSQLSFTITLLLGWRLLGESLTRNRVLALASAVLCIIAMARA
ncbi:MAG: EamA family transporter [Armatimonadota bacterium]